MWAILGIKMTNNFACWPHFSPSKHFMNTYFDGGVEGEVFSSVEFIGVELFRFSGNDSGGAISCGALGWD